MGHEGATTLCGERNRVAAPRLVGAVLTLALVASGGLARAADERFFLFVSGPDAPSQALMESAWKESRGVENIVDAETARKRIGQAFPRLFEGGSSVDKTTLEGDLKAGKAAYFATDFKLAETHLARAIGAAYDSPELLSSSAAILGRLADAAALRYTNALARKQPVAEAEAELRRFITRYPRLKPTPTEHAPEVIEAWEKLRAALPMTSLTISVLPLDLERSGTCRVLFNGDELATVPMAGGARVPEGEHLVQVRCGLNTSWLQRITLTSAAATIKVPVRAMIATRADAATGGLLLVAPSEGDSPALVRAVSDAAGFAGAVVMRPAPPQRAEIGLWQPDLDSPILSFRGEVKGDTVIDVRPVRLQGGGEAKSLSPWPFVFAGAGVAALAGGVVTNMSYIDDRDAGVQELDATPSVVLYGVGGALVATGIVLFVLDITDDDPATSTVTVSGPGRLAFRF